MSRVTGEFELRLQRAGMVLWALACAVGVVTLAVRYTADAAVRAELGVLRDEDRRLGEDANRLDAQLRSRSAAAQQAAKEVAQELEQKYKLHLAMSDVLARAKALQGQRDEFEGKRQEILTRLKEMDQHYYRASQQTPDLQPR